MPEWIAEPDLAFGLVFRDGGPHEFCGEQRIAGATCGHCRRPLLRLLSFDPTDPRLNLRGAQIGRLPLLYCWSCQPEGVPFFYRLEPGGGVTVISSAPKADGPERPDWFPGERADLELLPAEDQRFLRHWQEGSMTWDVPEELLSPRHQVGGVPFLAQALDQVRCTECGRPMPFLATLAGTPEGNEIQVVFHYCRGCAVAGGYHFAS